MRRNCRRGDYAPDLLLDTGELAGQVCLTEIQLLRGAVDFHRQLGDAAVDEPLQPIDGGRDFGPHDGPNQLAQFAV